MLVVGSVSLTMLLSGCGTPSPDGDAWCWGALSASAVLAGARPAPGTLRRGRRCSRAGSGPLALLSLGLLTLATDRGHGSRRAARAGLDAGLDGQTARPLAGLALLQGPLGLRAGRRHAPDDVELLPHRPEVRREPVDEDTDGEVDARDGEEDGQDVQQHLLLPREGVVERGR